MQGGSGPQVAGVKQFLKKAGKPCSNMRKMMKAWEKNLLKTEAALQMVYETY